MREISMRCPTRGRSIETESFVFPGGELQVQIPEFNYLEFASDLIVTARLQSAESIIQLALASEIIDRLNIRGFRTLVVPYFPYARQDRVMQSGESFSLKVIARLVNAMKFDRVVTCDPHSDVTPALVDRVEVIHQAEIVDEHRTLNPALRGDNVVVVAPDAGAAKKAWSVARVFGVPMVSATKHRDVTTGAITSTEITDTSGVDGRHAVIVDDICDGGRTFVELGKVLRQAGAARVSLYVTHGIFSKGLEVFRGIIDEVYTTDTFLSDHIEKVWPMPFHAMPIDSSLRGFIS